MVLYGHCHSHPHSAKPEAACTIDVKLWPLSGSSHRGKAIPTNKTHVASMRRWVATNCVLDRVLQISTEPEVKNVLVPDNFLVEGQVSGLGTVHPLLTLNVFSTWLPPLLKRKTVIHNGWTAEEEEERTSTR